VPALSREPSRAEQGQGPSGKGKKTLGPLASVLILLLTILLGLTIGIAGGYGIITGILSVFARSPRMKPAPVLVEQQTIGD